ncbi:MAG TPA: hypothetical protein PLL20_19200 [Phycisphaerae bacterium]|nr:hypothetical protein [Phycisphaerae bacterium]
MRRRKAIQMSRVLGILCVLGVSGPGIGADPKMPAEPTSGVWIDPARPYEVSGKLTLVVAQRVEASGEANDRLQKAVDFYQAYVKTSAEMNERAGPNRELTPSEMQRVLHSRLVAIEQFVEVNKVFPETSAGLTAILWVGSLVHGQSSELAASVLPALRELRHRHGASWQGALASHVESPLLYVSLPPQGTPDARRRALYEAQYQLMLETLPKGEVSVDRTLPGVDLLLRDRLAVKGSIRASFLQWIRACEYNLSYLSRGEEAREWLRKSIATNQRIMTEYPGTEESKDADGRTYQFARRAAEFAAPPTTWPATSRPATSQPATTSAPSSAPEQEQGGDVVTLTSQPR